MIMEINLLPHREARRAADLRETFAMFSLGMVVVVSVIFFSYQSMKSNLAAARASVAQIEADIERYKPQLALVEGFKQQKKELQDKLDIIANLEKARSGPVRIFDELSTRIPERLWLTSIETKGRGIKLEGQSLDTGIVADFLRSLNASPYFINVDLDKTKGGNLVRGVRLVDFIIRADMESPVDKTEAS